MEEMLCSQRQKKTQIFVLEDEVALTVELVEGSIFDQQWLQTLASNISHLQETLNQQIKHLHMYMFVKKNVHNTETR